MSQPFEHFFNNMVSPQDGSVFSETLKKMNTWVPWGRGRDRKERAEEELADVALVKTIFFF